MGDDYLIQAAVAFLIHPGKGAMRYKQRPKTIKSYFRLVDRCLEQQEAYNTEIATLHV